MTTSPPWTTAPRPGATVLTASIEGDTTLRFVAVGLPATLTEGRAAVRCPIPPALSPDFVSIAPSLSRLVRDHALRVVTIGSSSTQGVGASSSAQTYPAQLARMLRETFPGVQVDVINSGIGGHTVDQMLQRLDRDVFAHRPDVVLWQSGTIEATNGTPVATYRQKSIEAIERIRARQIGVVLVDSQLYPGAGETASYEAYQHATREAARATGTPLIPRYAWMRHLRDGGVYSYAQMLAADQFHTSDLMYECVAHYAALGIAAAAYPIPATLP